MTSQPPRACRLAPTPEKMKCGSTNRPQPLFTVAQAAAGVIYRAALGGGSWRRIPDGPPKPVDKPLIDDFPHEVSSGAERDKTPLSARFRGRDPCCGAGTGRRGGQLSLMPNFGGGRPNT